MKKTVSFILIFTACLFFIPEQKAAALQISAKAYAVINAKTGTVLASNNQNEKLPMASTTKIMTGLILAEQKDLYKTVTVTDEMVRVEGSSMGLLPGDKVSYHDLLYGLMLASGNDAANTVAISLGGSVEKFVKLMNRRAKELGLKNTHFVTPSGLHDDNHYTTAYDLARLAAYALKNKRFAKACSQKSATLCYGNPPYKRMLTNHNKLLGFYDGAIGVKTGFTKAAGRCLVSAAKQGEKCVIVVTLNDPNDWQDHKILLDYGLSCLIEKSLEIPLKNTYLPVAEKGKNIKLNIIPKKLALTENEWRQLKIEVKLPQFVYAPISKGDTVGQIEYKIGGNTVGEIDIKSDTAVVTKNKYKKQKSIIGIFLLLMKNLC